MHPYLEVHIDKERSGDCWIWTGPKIPATGYPMCRFQGQEFSARRMMWDASGKPATKKSLTVKCGREDCVNPDHLMIGRREGNNPGRYVQPVHVQKARARVIR